MYVGETLRNSFSCSINSQERESEGGRECVRNKLFLWFFEAKEEKSTPSKDTIQNPSLNFIFINFTF